MSRESPPDQDSLLQALQPVLKVLDNEPDYLRPRDANGQPGGIVRLSPVRTTIVTPDIHARMSVVRTLIEMPVADAAGIVAPLIEQLQQGKAQLVCVGDYVHGEQRAADRWRKAMQEFLEGFTSHDAMDEEMRESLGTIEMLACLKAAFPEAVHLLKGNHENIRNQEGHGNHAFGKFAYEGQMVADYMEKFYPAPVVEAIDRFEQSLPLLTIGAHFLVSHAEPKRMYSPAEIRDYREFPEVIEGLTWTANGDADEGSVAAMLQYYLECDGPEELSQLFYFAGHRPVSGLFGTRAAGRLIQLHNPSIGIAAVIHPERTFDPEQDVVCI